MEFGEALSIVLTLATAQRATAETSKDVTEEKLDEAIQVVTNRVKTLSAKPLPKS